MLRAIQTPRFCLQYVHKFGMFFGVKPLILSGLSEKCLPTPYPVVTKTRK